MRIRPRWVLRLGIVAGTVLVLAFAAQHALVARSDVGSGTPNTWGVQAVEWNAGGIDTGRGELRIEHLILDGQRLRFESLEGTDDWELVPRSGAGSQLVQNRAPGAARLVFQGKSFLMFVKASQWSGTVRVERDGVPVQAWKLDAPSGQSRGLLVEDPPAPVSAKTFILVLLLGGAAAAWLGPLRAERSGLPWLICFLAAVHLFFWLSHSIGVTNDSVGYLQQVSLMRQGLPEYFPPGYPIFLGIVESVAGDRLGGWTALLQHAMAVTAGVWSYLLLRRIAAEELALLAGILTGALAPIVTSSQAVMSEIPTVFAMAGALFFTVRAAETGRLRFAVIAGLLTGWAGILRVVPLAALLPAIGIVLLLPFTRRGLRLAGATLAVTAAIVLLPMIWFWYKSGQPILATSTGLHFFNRMVTEQHQLDASAPATGTLLGLLDGEDPRTMASWDVQAHAGLGTLSASAGVKLIGQVALESLRKDPWAYLKWTPGLAWRDYVADPNGFNGWGEMTSSFPRMENPPLLRLTAAGLLWRWSMERLDGFVWPMLCWGAIGGTILGMWSPQRKLVLAMAWVTASYLLVTASLESFSARYNVPIVPFVIALAIVPLSLLFPATPRLRVDAPHPAELAT